MPSTSSVLSPRSDPKPTSATADAVGVTCDFKHRHARCLVRADRTRCAAHADGESGARLKTSSRVRQTVQRSQPRPSCKGKKGARPLATPRLNDGDRHGLKKLVEI